MFESARSKKSNLAVQNILLESAEELKGYKEQAAKDYSLPVESSVLSKQSSVYNTREHRAGHLYEDKNHPLIEKGCFVFA